MAGVINDVAGNLAVVIFNAGPFRLAVEAIQIAGMQDSGPGESIEGILGLPAWPHEHERILLVRDGDADQPVLVGAPVELVGIPIHSISPLPGLVAARTQIKGAKAIAQMGGKVIILVDLSLQVAAHSVGTTQGGEQPRPEDCDQHCADAPIDHGGDSAEPSGSQT